MNSKKIEEDFIDSDPEDLDFNPENVSKKLNSDDETESDSEAEATGKKKNISTVASVREAFNVDQFWDEMKNEGLNLKKRQFPLSEYLSNSIKKKKNFEFAGQQFSHSEREKDDHNLKTKSQLKTSNVKNNLIKKVQDSNNSNLQVVNHNEVAPHSTANEQEITTKPTRKKLDLKLAQIAIKFGIRTSDVIRLNTLEKSKLDWNKFVESEGIAEDLKRANKDGYVEKVQFLNRTDERQAELLKNLKNHARLQR
ncbi:hypothetical protein HDU92_001686 [Lobulomyces angularis]|nr:hypothetical protein HDU92_001686 [Lobulomyces angularis]